MIKQAGMWFARMRGPDREALRPEFERWRDADPAHREAYEQAGGQWLETGGLADTEMGRNRHLPERRPPIWEMPGARPAFAAIALLLVVVAGFWFLRSPSGVPGGAVVALAEPQETRVGEIRTVKLADGSTVTLDTDSAIEVRLSGDLRQVRLVRGRARFDVAHDPARPFRVEAGGRTVTALGTLFDVGFEPGGVRVSLFRGSVDVRGLAPAGSVAAVTRLAPGECFTDLTRRPQVAKASPGLQQWVSGMLDFDGVPLGDVLEQTNRYSQRKIRLGDPSLAAQRVTGGFRPLPVDELAAALAAAFSLRVERSPQGDLILHRP
ncbi:FecR family protein [Sphingomonas canadensis]|uniref:FecR family protein n=1 Tax=Sphingomonas canadensis TaxID=1219257 RepID=A0ABW3H7Q6_9SPHN|nr:FecR domain-containing protein [Sphingomonas canadensis]MCW3837229.1 FecR domain-containing protein [Sphingomonas canadensis]